MLLWGCYSPALGEQLTVVGWSLPRDALKKQTTIIFSVTLHMAGYTTARINAIDRRSTTWLSLTSFSSFSPSFFQKCHFAITVLLSCLWDDPKIWKITKHNALQREKELLYTTMYPVAAAVSRLSFFVVAFPVWERNSAVRVHHILYERETNLVNLCTCPSQ